MSAIDSRAQSSQDSAAMLTTDGARLRGLIFEMGNVLYDATLWRRWLWQLVSRLGISISYADFCRTWDQDFAPAVCAGRRSHDEALEAFLLGFGLTWGQIDEIEAGSRLRLAEVDGGLRLLPGVAKTIDHLATAGLSLAILADGPHTAAELTAILERIGLARYFCAVLSSLELEAVKPAAQCYQAALDALELSSAETALVASDAASLSGATAVGIRTIAFNCDTPLETDARLERFIELPGVVDAWNAALPC